MYGNSTDTLNKLTDQCFRKAKYEEDQQAFKKADAAYDRMQYLKKALELQKRASPEVSAMCDKIWDELKESNEKIALEKSINCYVDNVK
jgi:hypothetical protein